MDTNQGNASAPGGALRADGDKLKDRILAAVSLALGFLLFELVLFEGFGLSVPAFVALFYAAAFWYLSGKPGGIRKRGLWLLIPIALLTACYALYSNMLLAALNTMLLMALVTLQLATMTGNRLYRSFSLGYVADLFHTAVALPVVNIPAPFRALRRERGAGKKSGMASVLIGLVIALPILLAVLALLSSADLVFEKSLSGLLEFIARHFLEYAVKILFGAVMGILFFGLMHALRGNKTIKSLKRNVDFTRARFMDEGVAGTVFVLVNAVYLLFIAVQFGYLFGAFSSILPEGFNHASYARRGFFELMAVSFLNLGMLAFSMLFSRRTGRKRTGFLKAMETALVVLTLLLLASAFSKMWFYMDAYGLTPLRLYTSWFMLLCAVVFVAVLAKLYAPKFALTRFCAVAFVALYLGLNFLNVDALIPQYNIDLNKSGKARTVDMTVFYDLSDSAVPYAAELASGSDPALAAKAMEYLNSRADLLNDNRWQTFTLDRYRAQQALIKAGVKAEVNPFRNVKVNAVDLPTGIEFPWNQGWTPAISVVPGLPVCFTYENPDCTVTVAAEGAELLAGTEDEDYPAIQQPAQLKSGDTVYWQMCDPDVLSEENDAHYVDAIVREQGHIVGYAVVKIEGKTASAGGKAYYASVLKNVSYLKTMDGQYQEVPESYVDAQIVGVKGE